LGSSILNGLTCFLPEMAYGLYDSDSGLRSGPGFTGIGCAVFQHHHTRFDFVPDWK